MAKQTLFCYNIDEKQITLKEADFMSNGILSIKLYELEKAYGQMQSRLRLCQESDHDKLLRELQELKDEYEEKNYLLEQNAENSRSPAVAALSERQVNFFKNAENIMKIELPKYLHSETADDKEIDAEAYALYAEYAIDFAVQSMRYALIAAMKAIDAQNELEKEREDLK